MKWIGRRRVLDIACVYRHHAATPAVYKTLHPSIAKGSGLDPSQSTDASFVGGECGSRGSCVSSLSSLRWAGASENGGQFGEVMGGMTYEGGGEFCCYFFLLRMSADADVRQVPMAWQMMAAGVLVSRCCTNVHVRRRKTVGVGLVGGGGEGGREH